MNDFFKAFICQGLGFLAGLCFGCWLTAKAIMNNAVKHGHAEYYLDSENTRQWRWKGDK